MSSYVLEVKDLKKQYKSKSGTVDAVKGISFHVNKGEIFGFLGANGAGKSTTINMVTTQLLPSSGKILYDGEDLTRDVTAIRRKIGVVAQHNNLERSLTAEENLYYHGRYFGMAPTEIHERSEELLNKFGLWDRRKDFVRSYSGGMAQRLKIARAMLHKPEILFLDEPTTGLDPNYRNILWDQMLKMNKEGTTIFLTTHYMEEVENFCAHVAIMKKGDLLAYGTVKELEDKTGTNSLNDVFLVLTNKDGVDERLRANAGAIFYTRKQLAPIPVMQVITLANPLTWVNEAIRGIMTPQIDSLPLSLTLPGIAVWILVLGLIAFRCFDRMVYNH